MILTVAQVAEKLGISSPQVRKLVKDGKLSSVNYDPTRKTKQFLKFDSKAVNGYKATNGDTPRTRKSAAPGPAGLMTRLVESQKRIEAKIDALIAMWK